MYDGFVIPQRCISQMLQDVILSYCQSYFFGKEIRGKPICHCIYQSFASLFAYWAILLSNLGIVQRKWNEVAVYYQLKNCQINYQ